MTRPLLFLDVDGPLNPFAAKASRRPEGYTTHRMRPRGWDHPRAKPLRVWLNPGHGAQLLALPYDLVWATTWADEANTWIAPNVGLPDLPHVDWSCDDYSRDDGTYFKTHDLVDYAAGRPFVWVDDETGPADREYVAAHHGAPALLHHVDPRKGLLPGDFEALAAWAAQLPGRAGEEAAGG
ncbi:hypothetical protein [Streptomyces synnematoformans]|uniref:Secreted protein n=1 Tax=Streptomyces synnematoformans TaxID=415721 RepID=A0ABN2XCW4_9ACTN